jgi:hypothetical protein
MSPNLPIVAPDSAVRHCADAIEGVPAGPPGALPLRSRNIGILCNDPQRPEVVDLQRVTTGMGARVALVRPDLGQADEIAGLEQMARVLAGFYDAVLCFGLPPPMVQRLGEAAAIPVVCVDGVELHLRAASAPAVDHTCRLLLSQLVSLCA